MESHAIKISGRPYRVDVLRRVKQPVEAPRLVIVGYQPNAMAAEILKLCVASIQTHTPQAHEIWVIDNPASGGHNGWLAEAEGINVAFNRTDPARPGGLRGLMRGGRLEYAGSQSNAIALEIAARLIEPECHYVMSLHSDVVACEPHWLEYLMSHLSAECRAVGVRLDTARVRTLHVLGMLFDFRLYGKLGLSYEHRMPEYDAGDGISIGLEKAGYSLWACENTYSDPSLIESRLGADSPYRALNVDRAMDDDGRVIFMHLGRGVLKAGGTVASGKTTPEEWLAFGRRHLVGA